MGVWKAILLGLVQGVTEFLPVSSSGHLALFNIDEPNNLQFTLALHAGTVLSTIVVFRREIWQLLSGFFKFRMNAETKFIINILIASIPVGIVGVCFGSEMENLFSGNLMLVGAMLLVTALLLLFANAAKPRANGVTPLNAFIIGVGQAIAVLPGLSRSGTTISTGLLLGVKREEVSKFSFLMVLVPVIGASILEVFKTREAADNVEMMPIVAGFLTAFVVGTLACKAMIRIVNKGKLTWFSLYCAVVGVAAIVMGFIK